MSKQPRTAGQVVERLPDLVDQMTQKLEDFRSVSTSTVEQWQRMGKIGAQRDDHAGQLLSYVKVQVMALRGWLATVDGQLDAALVDPFGDNPEVWSK